MAAPSNPREVTKVNEVKLQVAEVQDVMRDNVSKMLDNYEKAEVLEDKAGTLSGAGAGFCSPPRSG